MTIFFARLFIFVALPLLLWQLSLWRERGAVTAAKRWEMGLMFLFGLMIGGAGISNFLGHLFLSDPVATTIGWETGNPFQLEVGFANLAIGILGIIATSRRDGFREATVIAVTIFSVGATLVHLWDMYQTGNLAPGNSAQNVINLIRPILLIWFLMALHRTKTESGETNMWRIPYLRRMGILAGGTCSFFAAGYWSGQMVLMCIFATIIAIAVIWTVPQREMASEIGD